MTSLTNPTSKYGHSDVEDYELNISEISGNSMVEYKGKPMGNFQISYSYLTLLTCVRFNFYQNLASKPSQFLSRLYTSFCSYSFPALYNENKNAENALWMKQFIFPSLDISTELRVLIIQNTIEFIHHSRADLITSAEIYIPNDNTHNIND